MGLFDFFKRASKVVEPIASTANADASKTSELNRIIDNLGLQNSKFDVEVNGSVATVYGETEDQGEKDRALIALGNVAGIDKVDDRISVVIPEPQESIYEVKGGDSLSKIAKAHYGDAMKYNIIFEANRDILDNPDMIHPGQKLRIPKL